MNVDEMWKIIQKGDLDREKAHLPIDGEQSIYLYLKMQISLFCKYTIAMTRYIPSRITNQNLFQNLGCFFLSLCRARF